LEKHIKTGGLIMPFEHIEEKEAVEKAALIEKNGRAFYTLLSKKTRDPGAAAVFRRLAKEEKKHLEILEKKFFPEAGLGEQITDEEIELEKYVERPGVSEIFVKKINIEKLVQLIDDDKKALTVALETELHAVQFFENLAAGASTDEGRKLYLELAEEERGHVREIENLLG
jgi:rubrerythrin